MSVVEDFHRQHKERLARIASRAVEPVKKPEVVKEEQPDKIIPLTKEDQINDWVERQKEMAAELFAIAGLPTENSVSVERIQREVCRHYGIARTDMISGRRTKHLVVPRMVAIHLTRRLTTKSYPEIGRRFGGRDHTTCMHSDRRVSLMMADDVRLQASIEMMIEKLGGEMS